MFHIQKEGGHNEKCYFIHVVMDDVIPIVWLCCNQKENPHLLLSVEGG